MVKEIQVTYSLYQMYSCSQTVILEVDIEDYNRWKEEGILEEKLHEIALDNLTDVLDITITEQKD